MKNKLLFSIVLLLFISLAVNFYLFNKKISKDPLSYNIYYTPDNDFSNDIIKDLKDLYSLDEAINSQISFEILIPKINEEFNYKNLLLKQFSKVNSYEDFKEFQKIYGKDLIMLLAFKEKNIDLLTKFLSYQSKEKGYFTLEEVKPIANEAIESYKTKGYYDGELFHDGELDFLFLSLSGKSIDEKISFCDMYLKNNIGMKNKCKYSSYYMASSLEKQYCSEIKSVVFSRLCQDTYKK
ncbi:hypothetical protein BKN14_02945 [Candidatus Gracilibacteria bacterium HOT-871]|nr:hypothetical protein BKN14_02945 [Candidatus Gracilibacteria bacterium HOT-871]